MCSKQDNKYELTSYFKLKKNIYIFKKLVGRRSNNAQKKRTRELALLNKI